MIEKLKNILVDMNGKLSPVWCRINELVDTVNRLEESVQGVVNNSIKDGAYIQNLKEDVNSLRDDCNLLMGYIAPENGCEPTDEDLRDMIKDPKYWKEQDPETVHKVEEGFRKLYGDKGGVRMSDKLHCPFCQQELVIPKEEIRNGIQCCVCRNPKCEFDGWHFPVKLVQELINERQHATDCQDLFIAAMAQKIDVETELERTRKALDVAVDALKRLNNDSIFGMRVLGIADQALTAINEITKGNK